MAQKRPNKKPHKSFTEIEQAGRKAAGLAKKHADALVDRLPSGIVQGLGADLDSLKGLVAGSQVARARSKAATAKQTHAVTDAHAMITAVRTAVVRAGADKATQRAYGVGLKSSKTTVKAVVAAIQQFIDRAAAHPEEARSLGILDQDVDAARAALHAVLGADAEQEDLRAASPASTRERNAAARRIVAAVDRIAAAGILAFATVPRTRANFEALVGAGARKTRRRAGATPT